MEKYNEWLFFLQQHPEFYELSKSSLYITILRALGKRALDIDRLHRLFGRIEEKDFELIILSLERLKLIEKVPTGYSVLYMLTDLGKEMMQKYRKTRKHFKV